MITNRQQSIITVVQQKGLVQGKDIRAHVDISQATLNRELKTLGDLGWIHKTGAGRSTAYTLSKQYEYSFPIAVETYYQTDALERDIRKEFNFELFSDFSEISCFRDFENEQLKSAQALYSKKIKSLSPTLLQKEWERFTIELSWKSSEIEGNTYDLLETEALFKYQKKAEGKPDTDGIMLLNHKRALEYLFQNKLDFLEVNTVLIENIHRMLVEGLEVRFNLRNRSVGITGTQYKPLDNKYQIKEALDSLCLLVNKKENFFEKALLLVLGIAYLQPFEDGNKRTSRLLANAILMAGGFCPLSYRSTDPVEYKKALLIFYEKNNISAFKNIFIQQYEFAVQHYF